MRKFLNGYALAIPRQLYTMIFLSICSKGLLYFFLLRGCKLIDAISDSWYCSTRDDQTSLFWLLLLCVLVHRFQCWIRSWPQICSSPPDSVSHKLELKVWAIPATSLFWFIRLSSDFPVWLTTVLLLILSLWSGGLYHCGLEIKGEKSKTSGVLSTSYQICNGAGSRGTQWRIIPQIVPCPLYFPAAYSSDGCDSLC